MAAAKAKSYSNRTIVGPPFENTMLPTRRTSSASYFIIAVFVTLFGLFLLSTITTVQVVVQFDNPKSKLFGFPAVSSSSTTVQTVESSLNQFTSGDNKEGDRIDEEVTQKKHAKRNKTKNQNIDSSQMITETSTTDTVESESKNAKKKKNKKQIVSPSIITATATADTVESQLASSQSDLVEVMPGAFEPRLDIEVVNTSITFPTYDSDPYPNSTWPRIAWLMSFPNSGTRYVTYL